MLIAMSAPPMAKFLDHGGRDGDVTVLAAFGIFEVEPWELFLAVNVLGCNAHGFTDAPVCRARHRQATRNGRSGAGRS